MNIQSPIPALPPFLVALHHLLIPDVLLLAASHVGQFLAPELELAVRAHVVPTAEDLHGMKNQGTWDLRWEDLGKIMEISDFDGFLVLNQYEI